jgi:hypothetical protein
MSTGFSSWPMPRPALGFTAVGFFLAMLCSTAWAQTSAAERLEKLRLSMLERAAQAATRVDTTAWIDNQGRLQENSRFRQSLQFGEVPAGVASPLPESNRPVQDLALQERWMTQGPSHCPPSSGTGLKHVLQFETDIGAQLPANWQHPVRSALQASQWNAAAPSAWHVLPATPANPQKSRYEQALLDGLRTESAWRLKVSVQKPVASTSALKLVMTLVQTEGPQNQYQDESWLAVETAPSAWSAPTWTPATQEQLNARVKIWHRRISQWLSCTPVRPAVTAQTNGFFTIAAGQLAGVKSGDEWVLLQPERMASQALEPGTLDLLVHATVVEVTPHTAKLRIDAGMPSGAQEALSTLGTWQAWTWADLHAMMTPPERPQVASKPEQETRWPLAGLFKKFSL